ncbi:hypothetical protein QBC38DRAFT_493430 [Podospora fimiseda]|uniref:Zn(2)-C6 fungal-type domain-containing protein n=1 Tax=Podospora fimiseda TaxID=252190 RepID=A0AAN7BCK4_9PEZI|nr:hypothetical protein QBC38DRAFT_493430 [Podospora fimiseda]
MFGTLHVMDDVRKPVPLQFVENRDLSSAFSRNSRDRPHVSCEFCRARKVRCSGEHTGCNRCKAVGAECRYPPREPRRKAAQGDGKMRRQSSSQGPGSGDDKPSSKNANLQKPQQQRDRTPAKEQENPSSANSPQIFDWEQMMESQYSYQNPIDGSFENNLAPSCSQNQSVKDGLDQWLDMNQILDTSLPSSSRVADNLDFFDPTMIDPCMVNDNMEYASQFGSFKTFDPPSSDCNSPGPDQGTKDLLMSGMSGALYPFTQLSEPAPSESSGCTSTSSGNRSRHSTVGTSPSYTSNPSSRGPSCSCLQLAACLVEDLSAKAAASDRADIDVLLGDFRSGLAQCSAIINCERCVTARENNMLLAMAAKYMSTICECVAVCYAEMRRTQQGSSSSNPDEIRFSTYLIENNRERIQVLGCLVNVQINEFAQMVARLKSRPGVRRGHLMLLTEAGNKVNTLQAILRFRGGDV